MYKRLKKIKKLLPLYIMALPALVYLFINNYLPLTGMVVAFKDFDYSKGIYGSDWAGFRNFLFLFKNSVAFIITRNTILYNVAFIIINTFLGILVAILLSEVTSKKALKVYQTVILLPYLFSIVIIDVYKRQESGLFVIKPSGVDYDKLTPEMMVVMDLNGNKVEGDLNPSSDTATHLELYKAFPEIGGIVHTHSSYATSWAQAGRDIPCYGTTHADYIYGPVPCVRCLTKEEIEDAYEENTGHLIVNEFKRLGKDPKAVPVVCLLYTSS